MRPCTRAPGVNTPVIATLNQAPNSAAFVRARQTRVRGACSRIVFSIQLMFICNLMVADYQFRTEDATRRLHDGPAGVCACCSPAGWTAWAALDRAPGIVATEEVRG